MLPPFAIASFRSRASTACFCASVIGHFVQVGALVGLEARAVLRLHQAHAKLVEPVALARLVGVEDGRSGDVQIGLGKRHQFSVLSGQ